MEAVVFDGKTKTLTYQKDYPMPKITKDDEVIVKIEYAGICGTDLHIIQGEFPASKDRPLPLGHESSGVIHEVGKKSVFKVGQKVAIDPNRFPGNLWVTTLHHHGHREVTVSEMNTNRLEIVKKLDTGFRLVSPDVLEKEKQFYDVIIDCTGVGKVMELSFNYLQHGGKYILFGCCPPTHQCSLNPFHIYDKELTLIGVKINPFSFPSAIGWIKAMGSRYLDYEKLGVKTYRLSEYQAAMDDLKAGTVAKALFKIT